MAEYIDREKLLKKTKTIELPDPNGGEYHIDVISTYEVENAPIENVVPRSEVEYKLELLDVYKQNCGEIYITDNGGIAPLNTIVIDSRVRYLPMELVTLIKKAKQEVAREISEKIKREFCGAYTYKGYTIERYIAELEKKYIGE